MSQSVSTARILSRVGEQLTKVLARLSDVEDALCDVIRNDGMEGSDHFLTLQEFDRTKQALDGIARFLETLAGDPRLDLEIDPKPAASAIGLEQLAAALGFHESPPDENPDCEFFQPA